MAIDGFFQLSPVFDVTSERRRDCRAAITTVTRTCLYIDMAANTTMTSTIKETIPSVTPKDVKNEWIDDMRDWPDIQYGDIYNYLVSNKACDGLEMKNYKSMDSYNYFKSGSVGKILHHIVDDNYIIMKTDVRPSQRVRNEHHSPWMVCHFNGTIHNGGCSCMAGKYKTCSHVGAMLWKLEYAVKRGLTGKSCTDVQATVE